MLLGSSNIILGSPISFSRVSFCVCCHGFQQRDAWWANTFLGFPAVYAVGFQLHDTFQGFLLCMLLGSSNMIFDTFQGFLLCILLGSSNMILGAPIPQEQIFISYIKKKYQKHFTQKIGILFFLLLLIFHSRSTYFFGGPGYWIRIYIFC